MSEYRAPLERIFFTLFDVLGAQKLSHSSLYVDATEDVCRAVLEEAAKLAEGALLPLNASGDREGCIYDPDTHSVTTPKGFVDAYRAYREGGWSGLGADPEFGGQGLTHTLQSAVQELICSTNLSIGMYPGLSHGAIDALVSHGSDDLKQRYLTKLVSGEWTGTMCLTEPQCGTDLGLLRTRAEPVEDGSYRLEGTKIWITGGEHDLVDNIIHLVLARLPDAPAGSHGISLFLVPKIMPDGQRNAVYCGGLEHKMGINGSATCVMNFDGASGWIIGEPNQGLKCMFTMMNAARLMVGIQGLGAAETAYQVARHFAEQRLQGKALGERQNSADPADPIMVHPDVRRMLLQQKVMVEGSRAMAYWTAMQIDLARCADDEMARQRADDVAQLMTPVVKAFLTDEGFAATDLALQTLGGAGYTKDWPVEQLLRDVRISRIYEGTNGVQALDLVGRKLTMHGGRLLGSYFAALQELLDAVTLDSKRKRCEQFLEPLKGALDWLLHNAPADPDQAAAAASPLLRMFALATLAVMWARLADQSQKAESMERYSADTLSGYAKASEFYFSHYIHEMRALAGQLSEGKASLMAMSAAEF